jgi:hypothetical protein
MIAVKLPKDEGPCCPKSLSCLIDTYVHALHLEWIPGTGKVCDMHDNRIMKTQPKGWTT